MAECHPVGFRWVMEARRRGATVIHVDPRFTRTSAMADLHLPIRAGTDVAFLGGLIRHVIETGSWFREYVLHYTNAATLVSPDFRDTEDLDGLFSGYDRERGSYDARSWQYEGAAAVPAAGHKEQVAELGAGATDETVQQPLTAPPRDDTLQHPRCVFQIVRRHFSRYTPGEVERICGIPRERFLRVADLLCRNSGRERTTAIAYSVGWTQHTTGAQIIRAASILQLLLGNIGRPGGGILALRGHASIQGSTDVPTLFDLLPGYLPMPHARQDDLSEYIRSNRSASGWWSEMPKYIVSLLKAWFGEAATPENGFCWDWLPRLTGDHSHMNTVARMVDGKVAGYFVVGENPVVGSVHGSLQRAGLRRLEWLVVRDFAPTETAEFWKRGPEFDRDEIRSEQIGTEVFFFPCAAHTEKDGTFTNTQRLLQWHAQAVEPPGDARSDLWFFHHLGLRLKQLYADSTEERDAPIRALVWDTPTEGPLEEPSAEAVLREINGWELRTGRLVEGYEELEDDGSTACGCWLYSGCMAGGVNRPARRKPASARDRVASEWGWSWPGNRRLLYNRASADPQGRPWSERKRYVWWDAEAGRWTGYDLPDFPVDRPPDYRPSEGAEGLDTIPGDGPFVMQADSRGWMFAPSGLRDGPLPVHYEPQESAVANSLYGQQCSPTRLEWRRRDNPYNTAWEDERFPFVLTTFRLTEHHTAGAMSRQLSWLSELMPEMFCEVSPELATLRGLKHGGWATLCSARGEIACRVLVTRRLRPLLVQGRTLHQIAVPWHWGSVGLVRGDSANELLGFVGDPNVHIQESKALTVDIRSGRRSRQRRAVTTPGWPPPRRSDVERPRDLPVIGPPPPAPPEVKS